MVAKCSTSFASLVISCCTQKWIITFDRINGHSTASVHTISFCGIHWGKLHNLAKNNRFTMLTKMTTEQMNEIHACTVFIMSISLLHIYQIFNKEISAILTASSCVSSLAYRTHMIDTPMCPHTASHYSDIVWIGIIWNSICCPFDPWRPCLSEVSTALTWRCPCGPE